MGKLIERARVFFRDAAESPEGQWLLRGYIKDLQLYCQFSPKDDEPFHVEIINGKVEVKEGRLATINYDFPNFVATQKDFVEIFQGKVRPFEAKRSGKWEIRVRDRRGGIFTGLIRIGQDIVRERTIQNTSL